MKIDCLIDGVAIALQDTTQHNRNIWKLALQVPSNKTFHFTSSSGVKLSDVTLLSQKVWEMYWNDHTRRIEHYREEYSIGA